MEKKLGRPLEKGEIVHHKDEDKKNNKPSNLELMASQSQHAKHHAKLPELKKIKCPECDKVTFILARQYRHNNIKGGSAGPFCGKSCAGRWSRKQQIKKGQINLRASVPKLAEERSQKP